VIVAPAARQLAARLPPLDDVVAERCRRSFRTFVQRGWPNTPRFAAVPLVWNWHLDAIADHLQAVARGDIQFLLINQPPRTTKTEMVGVFFLPWIWTWAPSKKMISASKIAASATETSVFCRELIEQSDWYQRTFVRSAWQLRDDKNAKNDFANTVGGTRFATSLDGTVIGRGADILVGDDLQDDKSAQSEVACAQVIEFWDGTLSSRAVDPARVAKIYVSQRLSRKDLSEHLIASGRYTHLCLPTEYDPKRSCVTNVAGKEFWRDPRVEAGELLNPRHNDIELERRTVEDMKTPAVGMGPRKFAAQHNQDPSSETGGEFKREYWRFFKPDGVAPSSKWRRPVGCVTAEEFPAIALPAKLTKYLSIDCAAKPKQENDPTVSTIAGIDRANVFALDISVERHTFDKQVTSLVRLNELHDDLRAKLVEDKSNGSPLLDMLRSEIPGLIGYVPKGTKEERARAYVLPRLAAGQIYLPEGAPWVEYVVEEFANFPNGAHDDVIDTFSQLLGWLGPAKSSALTKARALAKW
jgi:predicted phage terminase large subunit-like protein